MYSPGNDIISWSVQASERMRLTIDALIPYKPIYAVDGDANACAYTFSGDTDMGIWRGSSYMYIGVGGNWKIAMSASSLWANPTSGSASDYVKRASSGQLFYTTSSQRYKERIETIDTGSALTRIKALRPVEFYYNSEALDVSNEMTPFEKKRGFIAEEMSDADHWYATYGWYHSDDPESADYTKRWMGGPEEVPPELSESAPVHWDYEAVIADMVSVVQNLEARLAALEA